MAGIDAIAIILASTSLLFLVYGIYLPSRGLLAPLKVLSLALSVVVLWGGLGVIVEIADNNIDGPGSTVGTLEELEPVSNSLFRGISYTLLFVAFYSMILLGANVWRESKGATKDLQDGLRRGGW